MTQYSFFGANGNGATGPASSISFGGAFVAGLAWEVTASGQYLYGYYVWRSDSGQSASCSCALWILSSATAGTFQAGTSASTTTMVTGAWNYIPLPVPFALATGNVYKAVCGLTGNFNDTSHAFNGTGTYPGGITHGPITCYSSPPAQGGTNGAPFTNTYQGSFGTSGSDPTANLPSSDDVQSNFWVDILAGPPPAASSGPVLIQAPPPPPPRRPAAPRPQVITAPPSAPPHSGAAALAGAGILAVPGVTLGSAAPLGGSGNLTAAPAMARPAAAALAGTGTLGASGGIPVWRLFSGVTGPATPATNTSPITLGTTFAVRGGGNWLEGYWWWCCNSGQPTTPVSFATWSVTSGSGGGTLVTGSQATSGTLTPGAWNWVPLTAPIQLAPGYDPANSAAGSQYVAATGTAGNFPALANQFGSGDPYAAGITAGNLTAYAQGLPGAYITSNGTYSTAGGTPSTVMPAQTDGSYSNFFLDVQVSAAPPPGYSGSYRLWPNKADASPPATQDSPVNYVIATEIHLTAACALDAVWYYSPPGTAQLATRASVWTITGAGTGTETAAITSPSWSGAAGSGWVSAAFPGGTTLAAGSYKVSVYNSAATPDGWGAKDAGTDYWQTGTGSGGITWGPLTAPDLAASSLAYAYDGSGAGNTPPYSDGAGTTLAGQPTFAVGPPDQYPYLYAPVGSPADQTQNYWIDLEATPLVTFTPAATLAGSGVLAAAGVLAASAALAGSGTLTVPGEVLGYAAALSGAGSMAVPGVILGYSAALTGPGTLAVPGVLLGYGAALAGAGVLAVSPLTLGYTAALTGAGTLSATGMTSGQFAGAAPLTGSGDLTAPGVVLGYAAALAGAGTVSAAGITGYTAPLTGSGSLAGAWILGPAALLAGAGLLSGGWALGVTAPLTGTGTLTAAPAGTLPAAALLTGTGLLTAAWQLITPFPFTGIWAASPLPPRWHATPLPPRWKAVLMEFEPIAAASLEYIPVLWTAGLAGTDIDPTGETSGQPQLAVQFAVPLSSGNPLAPAEPAAWYTATWLTGTNIRGYVAQGLTGPSPAPVQFTAGMAYDVWSQITGNPESPRKFAGTVRAY